MEMSDLHQDGWPPSMDFFFLSVGCELRSMYWPVKTI